MVTTSNIARILCGVGAVFSIACAAGPAPAPVPAPAPPPAAVPGTQPGDEALTCEQIYAQGAAESEREQQERARRNDARRQETHATVGLIAGAMLMSGVPGAGPAAAMAANTSAENLAAKTVAEGANVPPVNARKERLRELWTRKQCVKK